jgi:VanZ family protein
VGLIFVSAAAGFSPADYSIPSYKQSDKALHFIAFFLLTSAFYWIMETARRRVLQYTFIVCTVGLGVASEVVQGLLPVSYTSDLNGKTRCMRIVYWTTTRKLPSSEMTRS